MRIILTGALLCAFASTAFAAEHYVEVWNPPEARSGSLHASAPDKKGHSKKVGRHHAGATDHVSPRRIAEPAMRASATLVPIAPSAPATNRHPLIAPKLGPDGRIMQVGYRLSARHAQAVTLIR